MNSCSRPSMLTIPERLIPIARKSPNCSVRSRMEKVQ